ncbi:MAG: hypothetical protein ACOYXA_09675 [Bacteroidota bacterium]
MAKAPAKKVAKAGPSAGKSATPKKKPSAVSIEAVCETVLAKLKALNLDSQLQADMEWCLGSYKHDHNPVGLFETCERALQVFRTEQARKTKGVTAKLITDMEKALAAR